MAEKRVGRSIFFPIRVFEVFDNFMPRSFRSESGVESISISNPFCDRGGGTHGPSSIADEA